MALAVYSGKVRLCASGIAVPFRDMNGRDLATGDIVVVFAADTPDPSLTVVLQDDGTFGTAGKFYVMGIASIDLENEPGYWRAFKLKDHGDVIDGERWAAWGFSYREEQLALLETDDRPEWELRTGFREEDFA